MVAPAVGAEAPDSAPPEAPRTGWSTSVAGGYLHQFKTGFEDASGEFDVNRFISRASVSYMPDYTKSISLSIGYNRSNYGFSGPTGLAGSDPWNGVNTISIGVPVRWGFHERWTLFIVPAMRWAAEDGADWARSISGGGFAGLSVRISDHLTLGPGFGALTQLEDRPAYFPVLIIDWKITENLKLETGRGLGASLGPGLQLSYAISETWLVALGGRYERFRFRLHPGAPSPGGVGQDSGMPIYVGARYSWSKQGSVSLLGGVNLGGELRLDDASGEEVTSSDYNPAPFLGLSLDLKF